MGDIANRLFHIGKAYLDAAKGRIESIDLSAQQELSRVFPDSDPDAAGVAVTSSDDPFVRAQSKIQNSQRDTLKSHAVSETALDAAYRIIGVPTGSDYVTVESAVEKLRRRCDVARFPEASAERTEANAILEKVDQAFRVIKTELKVRETRFDRLEL